MKKECDKNGLEYELLMQESTKERFLRQAKSNPLPFKNFANSFVILKQKRDSDQPEPAEIPAIEDEGPLVGAPRERSNIVVQPGYDKPAPPPKNVAAKEQTLGFPLALKTAALDGKLAIAGLSKLRPERLLISLRDIVPARRPAAAVPTVARPPPAASAPSIPSLPSLRPISFPSRPAPSAPFPSLPSISFNNPFDGILGAPAPKKPAATDDAPDAADEE